MANIFDIRSLAGTVAAAKDKALAFAGEYGLNDLLGGHVLPPLPPFPRSGDISINRVSGYDMENISTEDLDSPQFTIFGTPMCFPLSIKLTHANESEWWLLPVEPMITMGGGNTLVRRNVAKGSLRGTIKERWSQDDYSIDIQGIFTKKDEWTYPQDDVKRMWQMLEARDTIDVQCELFDIFGIDRIAVEKFDFPFTKGEENQAYKITAWSDDNWALFLNKDGSPALIK